jgi:5,10-methylene-tetrahydrofolate dehydrogenase/methenyl tetrahydrofolate cyclohydrolase
MTGKVIDGNVIAATIRQELKTTVDELKEKYGMVPGLAVVLIGARRDSATYVRMKKKACTEIGLSSFGIDYGADVTQDEVIAKIDELNANPLVHGILVQLPIPAHLDEQFILERIAQHKDVDGLHPLNVAQLANTKTHAPGRNTWSFDSIGFHVSCTPQGSIELLGIYIHIIPLLPLC